MSKAFENFMDEYERKQVSRVQSTGSAEKVAELGRLDATAGCDQKRDSPTLNSPSRSAASLGCYGSGEPTADDGVMEVVPVQALAYVGPTEALILAHTRMLLSRSLAYVGLADLKCARQLSVEIRDHLESIEAYAFARGIAWEVAEAMIDLAGHFKGVEILKQND